MSLTEAYKPGSMGSKCQQINVPQRTRPKLDLGKLRLFSKCLQEITPKKKITDEQNQYIKNKREASDSSNKSHKPAEVNSSYNSEKPSDVTSTRTHNSNDQPLQTSSVGKLPIEHNQKKHLKCNNYENADLNIKCVNSRVLENNSKQSGDAEDKERTISVTNNSDLVRKSRAQFSPVEGIVKHDFNKNHNFEQDARKGIKEEESGWPELENEKDPRHSSDNWDDDDCSREAKKMQNKEKTRSQCSFYENRGGKISVANSNDVEKKVTTKFCTENIKFNNSKLTSQSNSLQSHAQFASVEGSIKHDLNNNHNSEQDAKSWIKEEKSGWPKLVVEKDPSHSSDYGDNWNDFDCSTRDKKLQTGERTQSSYQRSFSADEKRGRVISVANNNDVEKKVSTKFCAENIKFNNSKSTSQSNSLQSHAQFASVKGSIKPDLNKNHNSEQDGRKTIKKEEIGWPELEIEKDSRHSSGNVGGWEDEDFSREDKRKQTKERVKSLYQHNASTPYSLFKDVSGSRYQSHAKENNCRDNRTEVRNKAVASKAVQNYQGAPNNSYRGRSFDNDSSGDGSGSFSIGDIRGSSSGRSKWNGSQSYRPNPQLTRSKSLRDKTNFGEEISRANKTLVKNRSFVNSQDSVHEAADCGSDSCGDTVAQKSRSNFNYKDESDIVKSRRQVSKAKVDHHNEQLNSSAEWDKAWKNKSYSNHQIEDPKTFKGKPNINFGTNLEKTFNSTIRDDNSDLWSSVSETSDASIKNELDKCDKFKTRRKVIPTENNDPLTGCPSLQITCFPSDHTKTETTSSGPQVVQESSACKSTEVPISIEDYSNPVEVFFKNCSEPDIPAPRPVTVDINRSPESLARLSSETSDYNSISDLALVDSPTTHKVLEHIPDDRQISETTSFLKEIEAEKSMSRIIADKILEDIRRVIRFLSMKGYQVYLYGSYHSGLAVSTSNLNLALAYPDNSTPKNSFLLHLQKEFTKSLPNYMVEPFEEDKNTKKSKICLTERSTGVTCELVYFGTNVSKYHKLSGLLRDVCQYDNRIKTLLTATRIWAEVCLINEPEEGKLHTTGFTLLVLHFLQNLNKPLLPLIDLQSKDWGLKPLEIKNCSSVGELWLQFLKFYSFEFNWDHNVVTIHCKTTVLKSSKSWERSFIAIEDPFTQKNIGDSVESPDCAECIKSCFKSSYEYFLLPPESDDSDTSDSDTTGNQDCCSKKGTYSFNNISFDHPSVCEECEDLDEFCGKCKPSKETISQPFIEPLKRLSDVSSACVNRALHDVYKQYILPDDNIEGRKAFVRFLEKNVKEIYNSAKLTLFGSSVNGFGFKRSDLDICMTLERKPSEAEKSRILGNIVRHLRKKPFLFKNVFGLYFAKIPIIKFKFVPQEWHCDLSLYNVLGVHNSTLLCKYALMDERCRILGCALKLLAKKATINDTVLHTLSSYSYILMVIHYLQQVDPPVLPVLPVDKKKVFEEYLEVPKEALKNCNYWCFEDVNALKRRYMPQPMNTLSVGELWLGLIDFLTRYDGSNAFTITQKEPMPSTSLQRCARLFNIEDPFLIKRNLGCILNDTGVVTTLKVLGRARLLFGKEIPLEKHCDPKQYLFSSSNLTGQYITEKECLSCGGFGHVKTECEKDNPFKRSQRFKKPSLPYKRKV